MSSVIVKVALDQPGCRFNALPFPYIYAFGWTRHHSSRPIAKRAE